MLTLATAQLSLVAGAPRFTEVAKHLPASVLTVILDGQAIVGSVLLSMTVTVPWQEEDAP